MEEIGSFGVCFPQECIQIAGNEIDEGSNLFFENLEQVNQEMSHLAFFAVTNLLNGRMGSDYPFFLAEYEGILLALFNIDERFEKEHILREIRACIGDLVERMERDFRVEISISISDIHCGFDGIPSCYQEVQKVMEYRSNCKTEPVLLYQDIDMDSPFAALERAAISEIRGHSYRKAQELLTEAARVSESEKDSETLPQPETIQEDPKSLSLLLAYIDAHYTDPEFTVSAIAQQFNMTPSYLSLFFKRKTQFTPLEYIHKKRIEQVKLLLETDMPIKTIARQTGYFDARPMIRFFKRMEGITPTEYRERIHPVK